MRNIVSNQLQIMKKEEEIIVIDDYNNDHKLF